MTPRGLGLTGAVVLLWVAARAFGIPELQMAAVGCLVLVASATAWALLLPARVSVDRTVGPATLWFDGEATVRLTFRNVGRLSTPVLRVRDEVPPRLATRVSARLDPLPSGSRVSVTYRLHGGQRGRFILGPVTMEATDPFGLVTRTRTQAVRSEVTVYPPVWHLPNGLPLGGATSTGNGRRRRSPATGDELADIREYVRGDDLRSVHWPSTAHRGKLMVRRTESTRSPSAVVVVDRREDRHLGHGAGSSFETTMAAAASAGHHLVTRGRAVTLLDSPVAGVVRALPWDGWLDRLAVATPEPVDLPGLLRQVGEGIAGDGTLIAIVTIPDPLELRMLVRAGRGFTTRAAVLIDAASHVGHPTATDASAAVASLRAAGWRATLVSRGDRLDERWRELTAAPRSARTTNATPASAGPGAGR